MEEIWKDIKEFEGYYQISNLCRIKSLERSIIMKNGVSRHIKSKILKKNLDSKGYYCTSLYKEGKRFMKRDHRLLAEAFLEGCSENLSVNHKDGDRKNNSLENLEFISHRENISHAWKNLKTSSKYTGVTFQKETKSWRSYIKHNGKRINLGSYKTEIEAYNSVLDYMKKNNIQNIYK